MFAVLGATGQTGKIVVEALHARGMPLRAVSRDPARSPLASKSGIGTFAADVMDRDSLAAAFKGVTAAFVMLPPFVTAEDSIAQARVASGSIVSAIQASDIKRVVALSSGGAHLANGSGIIRTLYELEHRLAEVDAEVTLIRAADFMENWAAALPAAVAEDVLPTCRYPLDVGMQTVSTRDVGLLAADCLIDPRPAGTIYNLVGPMEYSPNDFGLAASKLLGRNVTTVHLPLEAMRVGLREAGIGADYVQGLIEIYTGLNSGLIGFEAGIGQMYRGSTTVEAALRDMLLGQGLL
jgi:NAD(P)H dehydrogenase (quinone)